MRDLLKQSVNLDSKEVVRENKLNNLISQRMDELLKGGEKADDEIFHLHNNGLYDYDVAEYRTSHANPCISGLALRRHSDEALLDLMPLLASEYCFSSGQDFSLIHKSGPAPYGAVVYGNISMKGGMLDLFHEIVHSWQAVAWPRRMHMISMIMTSIERAVDYKEDVTRQYELDRLNKNLESCCGGLSCLSHHDYSLDTSTKNNCCESIFISIGGETFLFSDSADVLSKAVSWHIKKERHAWLVAIHLLKKIAKNFVNLEPEMSENEMRSYAQNHLQTCENGINNILRHDWRSI